MIPAHEQTTAEQERLLKRVTSAAVLTAAVLILAKLAAYLFTQSVSVLASLIDSLMDVGASFLNLLAVRYALQPPDEAHRFGHGKAESVAGLAPASPVGLSPSPFQNVEILAYGTSDDDVRLEPGSHVPVPALRGPRRPILAARAPRSPQRP